VNIYIYMPVDTEKSWLLFGIMHATDWKRFYFILLLAIRNLRFFELICWLKSPSLLSMARRWGPSPAGGSSYFLLNLRQHKHRTITHTTIPLTSVDLLAIISLTYFVVVVPAGAAVWYYYGVLVYHSVLSFFLG
jgi:hypothetical protein